MDDGTFSRRDHPRNEFNRWAMKYKVTHTTTYDYSANVPLCQNETHLTPRNDAGQTCEYHRLAVHPKPAEMTKRTDYFGNTVNQFALNSGHRRLRVTAISRIRVHPATLPDPASTAPWEQVRDAQALDHSRNGLDVFQFAFASPHVECNEALAAYAQESLLPGRPILQALVDLTRRMNSDVVYDSQATTVSTPVMEVFEHRRGVCQDMAHLQIACLRSLGLAARYVSGYLRTVPLDGAPRLVGADASHAWLSLYCGEAGWIDADPTNNALPDKDHITVAWGRDYSDVCPINGMFVGGGRHKLTVAVNVVPL